MKVFELRFCNLCLSTIYLLSLVSDVSRRDTPNFFDRSRRVVRPPGPLTPRRAYISELSSVRYVRCQGCHISRREAPSTGVAGRPPLTPRVVNFPVKNTEFGLSKKKYCSLY